MKSIFIFFIDYIVKHTWRSNPRGLTDRAFVILGGFTCCKGGHESRPKSHCFKTAEISTYIGTDEIDKSFFLFLHTNPIRLLPY
jgi:hypothetical protein